MSERYDKLLSGLRAIRDRRDGGDSVYAEIAHDEIVRLRQHLQEMVDMVAPTLKSEFRLSQGLSSALIRARQELER